MAGRGRLIYIHGRPLLPREQVAVVTSILFGLVFLATSFSILFKWTQGEVRRALTRSLPLFAVSVIRLLAVGFELGFAPETRSQTNEAAIAIFDAIALVPLLLALLTCLLPSMNPESGTTETDAVTATSKHSYSKLPIKNSNPRDAISSRIANPSVQRIVASLLFLTFAIFVIVGTALSFSPDTPVHSPQYVAGVSLLRTGVILFFTPFLIVIPLAVWRTVQVSTGRRVPDYEVATPWYTRLVMCGAFVIVRFIWAIGSAFSVRQAGAAFNPFRDTKTSVWMNLGLGVVMEALVVGGCMLPE